jgi:predicted TIM-barrel fold metal-dependent hydrolase
MDMPMLQIVDAHAHMGPWYRFAIPDTSPDAYLSLMDHLGIGYAVLSHQAGLAGMLDYAAERSRELYAQSNGRILSYLVYDPHQIQESLRLIEASIGDPHLAGIKIHPTMFNCPADDERYRSAWELADAAGLVILSHTWDRSADHPTQSYSFPDLLEGYIAAYPNVRLILGHAGGRYNAHLAAARLAATYPNVYMDLAGDGFCFGRVKYLISKASSKRILYGSDAPWMDPRLVLGELLGIDITDDDLENILGRNAIELFGLPTHREAMQGSGV